MTLSHRRRFMHLAAGAVAMPALSRIAEAQAYPSRPVRIVAGFPPGSQIDIVARLIGRWLQDRLGQPFVIENRPGAAGNIATEAVLNAPADGYTLLMVGSAHAINVTLYDKLKFNVLRDIAPVSAIFSTPNVIVVHPSVPAKTVPEFITHATSNPGKLNWASAGSGSAGHLAGELFRMMTGVNLVHVPYRGSPAALTDLIGGQVQVSFGALPPAIDHIRAGSLRALAVTGAARSKVLPNIPTVSEFLPGYEASTWSGLGAPRSTSSGIIDRLNQEIKVGVADAKISATFADIGGMAIAGSPADFGRLIAQESEKWGKVIRAAKLRAD